jgi:hypothetical protein
MKSHLGKFAATMRDCDPDGVWNLAQRIWLEHGIAILIPISQKTVTEKARGDN